MQINSTTCCGIKEFHGVNENREKTFNFLLDKYNDGDKKYAFVIFSCNDAYKEDNDGEHLAKKIEEAGLGLVTRTRAAVNPNTSRTIKHFVWEIDHKATIAFCDVFLKEKRDEEKRRKEERDRKLKEIRENYHVGDFVKVRESDRSKITDGNRFGKEFTGKIFALDTDSCILQLYREGEIRPHTTWWYLPTDLPYLEKVDAPSWLETHVKKAVRRLKKIS